MDISTTTTATLKGNEQGFEGHLKVTYKEWTPQGWQRKYYNGNKWEDDGKEGK